MSTALSCREVCIDIESACILSNVDFTVEPGEFVAVLGANGSGKTTLMRAILGLLPITSGQIDVFGTPIGRFREWARLAYVPQRLHSAGAAPVSVHEVVGAGLISPRQRLPHRGDRQRVADALAEVGLADRRRDRFDALSGGQQRRVMIAAALAKDADLYVLDEPTAGVDAESQQRISETFGSLLPVAVRLCSSLTRSDPSPRSLRASSCWARPEERRRRCSTTALPRRPTTCLSACGTTAKTS